MLALTVGQVSGIIAAVITALQLFFPTALALLIVGLLKDDMSAVSWSSVGATLHSSYWATVLRADTAVSTNVHRSIRWLLRLASVTILVMALAAIITPLGLSDTVEPEDSLQDVAFPYLVDNGPFGYGTPQRNDLGFNRLCGTPYLRACPGSNTVEVKPDGDFLSSDFPFGYNTKIPQQKIDLFQSGLREQMQSVSSFFDIQSRAVTKQQDPQYNNGSFYSVGFFRQVGTVILDDTIEAIEGLLVNTADKGIAFRNHTLPTRTPLGAAWEEDLLVMEPETQCVDTNLTIDFTLSGLNGSFGGSAEKPVLTDRGGFINIGRDLPMYNTSASQIDPDLKTRAYFAAWAFNVMTGIYLNVTRPKPDRFAYLNSEVGKTFFMPESSLFHVDRVTVDSFSNLFSLIEYDNSTFLSDNSTAPPPWPNPFEISSSNYSDIAAACSSLYTSANSNMSGVAVSCGMVYGAPRRENGDTALFYEPGTRLSMPIYSCASAVKASVKTYSLRYNGTEGLKSLRVDSIREQTPLKTYWGVENNNDRKDLDIEGTPPLWGLVPSTTKPSKDLDVVKSPHLYLPGMPGTFAGLGDIGSDNIPGLRFHTDALATVYSGNLGDSVVGTMDYSGKTSFAMYAKWQQLMANATSASRIIDLIYTDLSANGLVGTKSWLKSSNNIPGGNTSPNDKVKRQATVGNSAETTARVPVRVYTRRIQYNYLFGIPAYISVFIAAIIGIVTLLYCITGRTGLRKIRHYLNATSPGRTMGQYVYPGESEPQTSTSTWVRSVGGKKIALGNKTQWRPVAASHVAYPEKINTHATGYGHGHGQPQYTNASTTNLAGYEQDSDPLIDRKNGVGIQMTPMHSPGMMPQHGGNQQYASTGGFQFGTGHVAAQHQGAYPPGGFAR